MPTAESKLYPFDDTHRLGGCLQSAAGDVLYVTIPKNASTSFQRLLLSAGFRYTTAFRGRPAPAGTIVFAVIREPVNRWLSAMLQYDLSREQDMPFPDFVAQQLVLLREGMYRPLDVHLTPQSTFLLPTLPVSDWLRFDRLDEDYARLAARAGLPPAMRHQHPAGPGRLARIRSMVTARDEEAVRGFYASDARLYERAQALHR